jgi:hypothetical protein
MLRRDAANERLQKINPAALWGEASEMECRLLAPLRHADGPLKGLLMGEDRKWPAPGQSDANDPFRKWTYAGGNTSR